MRYLEELTLGPLECEHLSSHAGFHAGGAKFEANEAVGRQPHSEEGPPCVVPLGLELFPAIDRDLPS